MFNCIGKTRDGDRRNGAMVSLWLIVRNTEKLGVNLDSSAVSSTTNPTSSHRVDILLYLVPSLNSSEGSRIINFSTTIRINL